MRVSDGGREEGREGGRVGGREEERQERSREGMSEGERAREGERDGERQGLTAGRRDGERADLTCGLTRHTTAIPRRSVDYVLLTPPSPAGFAEAHRGADPGLALQDSGRKERLGASAPDPDPVRCAHASLCHGAALYRVHVSECLVFRDGQLLRLCTATQQAESTS